jgi:membrane-bound lytic murein transglycosylase F
MPNAKISLLASIAIATLLTACTAKLPAWNEGKLVVIVPATDSSAEAEFNRELLKLFAEELHSELVLIPAQRDKIGSLLKKHRGHFSASSSRSVIKPGGLHYGPSYQTVREYAVCNREGNRVKNKKELVGASLAVISGSAQDAALREAQKELPTLHWKTLHGITSAKMLEEVSNGLYDCAAANELQLAEARNYHSNLYAATELASPSNLAWGFPNDVDPKLLQRSEEFFARIEKNGTLNDLLDRFYGHSDRLGVNDSAAFIERFHTVFPKYRHLFDEAALFTGTDWRLIAAIAYQESQWDPLATSFTNVRGMMMLTEATADRMNVRNRLDAGESIRAGAKYLQLIKDQLPQRIAEPDKTWMALAAYNQGYGHLEDARVLTKRNGGDPDSWNDVKRWMPLLNRPEYYETLKYGYARGGEAVILVENIRSFYDILKKLEPQSAVEDEQPTSYRLLEPIKKLLRR